MENESRSSNIRRIRRRLRRNSIAVMVTLWSILAVPACSIRGAAQTDPRTDSILTEKDAYLVLPAELISGPVVARRTLSPEGRNVAVLRKSVRIGPENIPSETNPNPSEPTEEQELIFWNSGARRPVTLWESRQAHTSVTLSEWMPGTESLFALIDRVVPTEAPPNAPPPPPLHEHKLLLLGFGIERAVIVPVPAAPFEYERVEVSPRKSLAVIQMVPAGVNPVAQFVLLHPNGRVGARIAAPQVPNAGLSWDGDGNPVIVAFVKSGVDPKSGVTRQNYGVNLQTGETRLLPKAPESDVPLKAVAESFPYRIVNGSHDLVQSESRAHIRSIWLESPTATEKPRALITADGSGGAILPGGRGVMFGAQNSLWFTPVLRISRAVYQAAKQAAERTVVMSRAKQIGLATLMYTMDNDEVVPGPNGVQANIAPYLGDGIGLDGLTYSYAGGPLSEVQSPSETILGYVSGPGGRANIYLDGHVQWQNE